MLLYQLTITKFPSQLMLNLHETLQLQIHLALLLQLQWHLMLQLLLLLHVSAVSERDASSVFVLVKKQHQIEQALLLQLQRHLLLLLLLLLHVSAVSERGASSVFVLVEERHPAEGFSADFAAILLDVRVSLKMRTQVAAVSEGAGTLGTLERLLTWGGRE